jgi:hypothetical protein
VAVTVTYQEMPPSFWMNNGVKNRPNWTVTPGLKKELLLVPQIRPLRSGILILRYPVPSKLTRSAAALL